MIKVEHSVVINRATEEVFAFLTNFENNSQWQSGIIETRQTPQSLTGVGTTVREVRQFMGRQIDATGEIIEYEPDSKICLKSISGPFQFKGSYTLESVEGGTKLAVVFEVQLSGFFRLAQSMVARELSKQIEADFSNLRVMLEAQGQRGT
ncbi:MAG: SRPBCC family protein [Candidatus Binatia bacterium]